MTKMNIKHHRGEIKVYEESYSDNNAHYDVTLEIMTDEYKIIHLTIDECKQLYSMLGDIIKDSSKDNAIDFLNNLSEQVSQKESSSMWLSKNSYIREIKDFIKSNGMSVYTKTHLTISEAVHILDELISRYGSDRILCGELDRLSNDERRLINYLRCYVK